MTRPQDRDTRGVRRRVRFRAGQALAIAAVLAAPAASRAQLPNAPVLQNAWVTPGIVVAANAGGGSDGSVYAAAASWAPSAGRFQLAGGGGITSRSGGDGRGVFGARIAFPMMQLMGGAVGLAGFVGVGGGSGTGDDTTAVETGVPAGVGIGYRRSLGSTRGFSVYATPHYLWASGKAGNTGLIRVAAGLDVGLSPRIGITGGIEMGQSADEGEVGPTGTLYGVGFSFVLGRR